MQFTTALNHTSQCYHKPYHSERIIVSVNVIIFQTSLGDLTLSAITRHRADIFFSPFLDNIVPPVYARIRGYSPWLRKDRSTQGGGAFCHKETVNVQVVVPPRPSVLVNDWLLRQA